MPAMLEGGKVDMIGVLPQFAKGITDNPKYKVLFTARDAVGPSQAVMWAIRADTIAAHRPALVDFFEDDMRAVRWFHDPTTAGGAGDPADVTKLPKERLAFAFTKTGLLPLPRPAPRHRTGAKGDRRVMSSSKVLPKPVELSPEYVDCR